MCGDRGGQRNRGPRKTRFAGSSSAPCSSCCNKSNKRDKKGRSASPRRRVPPSRFPAIHLPEIFLYHGAPANPVLRGNGAGRSGAVFGQKGVFQSVSKGSTARIASSASPAGECRRRAAGGRASIRPSSPVQKEEGLREEHGSARQIARGPLCGAAMAFPQKRPRSKRGAVRADRP